MTTKKNDSSDSKKGTAESAYAADRMMSLEGLDVGAFIVLNGKSLRLEQHPTDFSMIGASPTLSELASRRSTDDSPAAEATVAPPLAMAPLTTNLTRVRTAGEDERNQLMDEVRKETVAHHIYQVADTKEEIVIDDRIFLTLRNENPEQVEAIIEEFKLVPEGRMGNAYVLRVTEATGQNPLKTANAIAQRPEVASCTPQIMVPMQLFQHSLADTHRLFRRQWYLTADLLTHTDLDPTAGINAPEAWQRTLGSPDIVIAVIDDGFDLTHPAFTNKRLHPAERDFAVSGADPDPSSEGADYHGTCVASIATGSVDGDGMVGIAPGCTFLPIRLGFGPMAAPVDILEVFRYVSQFADVVNCSFGTSPASFDRFAPEFRNAITELTRSGGRRGKGLVMVFAAGNDDAPTYLSAADNRNGVTFVGQTNFGPDLRQIPAQQEVFSGYPMTRGVIVAGAMSSLKRKSGFSNWGPHITITAPSNNMHYITSFIAAGVNDAVRNQFVANYRGLGQIAAVNRTGRGRAFSPLMDDPSTPDFFENHYTERFGGTSGAAPVITGVVALMLSVNPNLTAQQVMQILMATADRDLDTTLDLANDPNIQGLSGAFVNGRSRFFGSGKVNAARAVERAQSLLGPSLLLQPAAVPTNGATAAAVLAAGEGAAANDYPTADRSDLRFDFPAEILPSFPGRVIYNPPGLRTFVFLQEANQFSLLVDIQGSTGGAVQLMLAAGKGQNAPAIVHGQRLGAGRIMMHSVT